MHLLHMRRFENGVRDFCVILRIDRSVISVRIQPVCRVGSSTDGETGMTEDLHRQRVLNFLDVFYSGDIEGALARCTDDIEFVANAPIDILPHMGYRRGKAAMRETWTHHPRPLFRNALRGADHGRRRRHGGGEPSRVLPQEQQSSGWCNSTSRPSTRFARVASRRSAKSSIRSTWSSRCSNATSARSLTGTGNAQLSHWPPEHTPIVV